MLHALAPRVRAARRGQLERREAERLEELAHVLWPHVLYEKSRRDVCVRDSLADGMSSSEARRSCAAPEYRVRSGTGTEDPQCTQAALARVERGAQDGAAVEVAATVEIELSCRVDEVRAFRLADVDADGRPEIQIDTWGRGLLVSLGSSVATLGRDRTWLLYEAVDFAQRFDVDLSEAPDEDGEATAIQLEWRDEDGDGRADIVLRTVDFAHCEVDPATGWPVRARETAEADDRPACAINERPTRVYLYHPDSDRFRHRRD